MKTIDRIRVFLQKPFFSDYRTLMALWLLIPVVAGIAKLNKHNNFDIFRYVFWHMFDYSSLYSAYPEYHDTNHYGPLFGLIIAPFALVPEKIGLIGWLIALSAALFFAIRKLPMRKKQQIFIYWFCAHELLTALFMQQFNVAIAAIIIATFYCINEEDDFWAAFFIVVGTLVKLYGIVGLAFIVFSKDRIKFLFYLLIWGAGLFALPMLLTNPDYIITQYLDWYDSLTAKNSENLFAVAQNISLLGMIRKITHCATYSDLWVIVAGLAVFVLPYFRIKQYNNWAFRYTLLASVMLFVVLFSTGSESSSYIIALTGAAIWYVAAPWKRSKTDVFLMVFAFILTSMSPSDLFPRFIRQEYIQPYALKALPCVLIWFKLSYEMCRRSYAREDIQFDAKQ